MLQIVNKGKPFYKTLKPLKNTEKPQLDYKPRRSKLSTQFLNWLELGRLTTETKIDLKLPVITVMENVNLLNKLPKIKTAFRFR